MIYFETEIVKKRNKKRNKKKKQNIFIINMSNIFFFMVNIY